MLSIIPVATSTLLADMTSYVPTLFNDLLPIIALILGLPLGFWIITKVVGLVRRAFATGGRRAI
jgi:hypothetical protein